MLIIVASRPAQRQLWPRNQQKQEQEKNLNFPPGLLGDVGDAEENMGICANLIFAEYVLENWPAPDKCLELKSHHGNLKYNYG